MRAWPRDRRLTLAFVALFVLTAWAAWVEWQESPRVPRGASPAPTPVATWGERQPGFLSPGDSGASLTFTSQGQEIVSIDPKGRVTLHDSPNDAARAFWQSVERLAPAYLDDLARTRCPSAKP